MMALVDRRASFMQTFCSFNEQCTTGANQHRSMQICLSPKYDLWSVKFLFTQSVPLFTVWNSPRSTITINSIIESLLSDQTLFLGHSHEKISQWKSSNPNAGFSSGFQSGRSLRSLFIVLATIACNLWQPTLIPVGLNLKNSWNL